MHGDEIATPVQWSRPLLAVSVAPRDIVVENTRVVVELREELPQPDQLVAELLPKTLVRSTPISHLSLLEIVDEVASEVELGRV